MAKTLSKHQLSEVIQGIIKEVLDEAGPYGYLSKTQKPDAKTAWDPNAQNQWADKQTPQDLGGQGAAPPPGGLAGSTPPSNLTPGPAQDKTAIGRPKAKTAVTQAAPQPPSPTQANIQAAPPEKTSSIADVTSLLQQATQQDLQQILSILQKGKSA